MADLGQFLQAGARRARQPAVWDCCAFPAAWALELCGRDPMAAWRTAYDTESGGERIAEQHGLANLFADGFGGIGWREIDPGHWQPGDVAVIDIMGRQAGAIFTGPRWAFVAARGLAFAHLDDECVLRAWGMRDHG